MQRLMLLLGVCCLTPVLSAAPPYPSMLTVKYKDQRLPVIHVHKTDPVAVVNGKEKEIWSKPDYRMEAAAGFADNFVDAPPGSLGGPFAVRFIGGGGGGGYSAMTYFEVPLTAKKTIKRGFAVLIIYSQVKDGAEMIPGSSRATQDFLTGTTIIVHDLPELPAGKPVKVKFTAGGGIALFSTDYFTQIFDDEGREVRTPDVDSAWQYYARRDRARLAQAVEKFLEKFKGADHDAVPAIMPKPLFPPEAVLPAGEVVIAMTVEADGSVSTVDASPILDAAARHSVIQAMEGWLFLPRLKAGQPVPTRVQVPLTF